MSMIRNFYRIARSVALAAILTVAGLYLLLYIALAIPAIQNMIRVTAQNELSGFLKGEVKISRLDIVPFSELRLYDVTVAQSDTVPPVLYVARVGAGIDLWPLVSRGVIDISYAELSGMKGDVHQNRKGGPLNIDFIIKAFAPKDKNKPPARFNICLRKVALRNTSVSFARDWAAHVPENRLDPNRIAVADLNADIQIPKLTNDTVAANLSRLSFRLDPGLRITDVVCNVLYTPTSLRIHDFEIKMPGTHIPIPELTLNYESPSRIIDALKDDRLKVSIPHGVIPPSDFAPLVPVLSAVDIPVDLSLYAIGNINRLDSLQLRLDARSIGTSVNLDGYVEELSHPEYLVAEVSALDLTFSPSALQLIGKLPVNIGSKPMQMLRNLGKTNITARGGVDIEGDRIWGDGRIATSLGSLEFDLAKTDALTGTVATESFDVGSFLGTAQLGEVAFNADASLAFGGKWPVGEASVYFDRLIAKGYEISDLSIDCEAESEDVKVSVSSSDPLADLDVEGWLEMTEGHTHADVSADIRSLDLPAFHILQQYDGHRLSAGLSFELEGKTLQDSELSLLIRDLSFLDSEGDGVVLPYLTGGLTHDEEKGRELTVESPWVDISTSVSGSDENLSSVFDFRGIRNAAVELLSQTFPVLQLQVADSRSAEKVNIDLTLKADAEVYRFWHLPLYPLGKGTLSAFLDAETGEAEINADFPYIQQGKSTLIERTTLSGVLNRDLGTFAFGAFTHYPTKKGTLDMDVQILGREGNIFSDIKFLPGPGNLITGNLALNALLSRNALSNSLDARVDIVPSVLGISGSQWNLGISSLEWKDGKGYINGLNLTNDKQYINIAGVASKSHDDHIEARLGGIDLDYVFGILNINYVTFGGTATGEVVASGVLSSEPAVSTRFFNVKDFSYNDTRLGDAVLRSWFDVQQKMVGIQADIADNGIPAARVDGGIWVTRDSLSFEMDANRINAGFLSPFVQAFATDVKGRASGNLKLYGTFSDIDLTGKAKAEDLSLRLLSTNVVYSGSDSVIMKSGRIEIPSFRVYDRYGKSALLSGWLTHRYFHEPVFDFRLSGANGLLCYDMSSKANPDWYGTIYGSGSGHLAGRPGWVGVDVDMTTDRNSTFTFVLSDKEQAADYNFLTFTDRRKEALIKEQPDTIPEFLRKFQRNRNQEQQGEESAVELDIRATVTPGVLVTLVMDPEAGDKITARGGGPLQMTYNSKSEEMKMYGKYVLDEGDYNFSLQDIILKQFTIRPGSSIAFNGDPLGANLDIAATYRVNANLTDLDQSFASDHDLNRTNVPVDAVLLVRGDLNQPDIDFDVELPTLTTDVERKVKSLMSTEDLLSRQIIYLLALNRFYTPENANMGTSGSTGGTELSSVASSTISSHLSNILSNMTDNLSLSPSFRSDKGDFSDVEVDLGLSSRLLDNRLLINGNLGYRDRNVAGQSTQFIGDFDIEYLLNRSGNLRLKAYNRFNDQNYYLRQALTTQGVGLVVRRDFDNIFSFLRPFRRKQKEGKDSLDAQKKHSDSPNEDRKP